jgi:hypothetical protein
LRGLGAYKASEASTKELKNIYNVICPKIAEVFVLIVLPEQPEPKRERSESLDAQVTG